MAERGRGGPVPVPVPATARGWVKVTSIHGREAARLAAPEPAAVEQERRRPAPAGSSGGSSGSGGGGSVRARCARARARQGTQLVREVELRVGRAADRRVGAAPLGVILALHDVERERTFISGSAVGAVEVKQQGRRVRSLLTQRQQMVARQVARRSRLSARVEGLQARSCCTMERWMGKMRGRRAPSREPRTPRGEFVRPLNGRGKARAAVPVLDGRPDGDDDRAGSAQTHEVHGRCLEDRLAH
jgi:hypothetical protein